MDESLNNNQEYRKNKLIEEGLVKIHVPEFDKVSSKAPVFYNSKMELNRDISVLALQIFQEEINKEVNICDVFGGSGIRGIRYKKEIPNTKKVIINDINPLANQFTQYNTEKNDVEVEITQKEANILLRECKGKFDIVDIDPFGTPSYFIDSASYSSKKESLLCITATDTSALCGTYKEPCIRKYNATPYKSEYCHENGIRILAGFIALTSAKYKKYIEIKLSHSSEHYMRMYIKIRKGSASTDDSLKENIGHIVHCNDCLYRKAIKGLTPAISKKCPECGKELKIAGPLWIGKIQNEEFIRKMIKKVTDEEKHLNTEKKILKLLNSCYEESNAPITSYDIHVVCKNLKISAPKLEDVLNKLKEESYIAIRTHFNPVAVKTDASTEKLKEIIYNLTMNTDNH